MWYVFSDPKQFTMITFDDRQLVQLGFKILDSLLRPAAAEAAEGFFAEPEAYEVEATQEG
jgi:hypothetical protein